MSKERENQRGNGEMRKKERKKGERKTNKVETD